MTDLTLVYFGAGWDMQPLSMKDYRPFKRFIFIDALSKISYYQANQAGYVYAKDRQSYVSKITEMALRKGFRLCTDEGNHLRFRDPLGRYLDYYINTTVLDSLADPTLSQIIRDAKWLHVAGFWPTEFGLNTSRDMPNLFANLAVLRERTKRAPATPRRGAANPWIPIATPGYGILMIVPEGTAPPLTKGYRHSVTSKPQRGGSSAHNKH